jgi:hypothetical protein
VRKPKKCEAGDLIPRNGQSLREPSKEDHGKKEVVIPMGIIIIIIIIVIMWCQEEKTT